MAKLHSKHTEITLDGDDLTEFCTNSQSERNSDKHDVTTYGQDNHAFAGGLGNGAITISGLYDDGATGPKAIIEPLVGTVVPFVRRIEGTGTGKPTETVNVLVEKYVETSPVADMVTWSADLQPSGDVTFGTQV